MAWLQQGQEVTRSGDSAGVGRLRPPSGRKGCVIGACSECAPSIVGRMTSLRRMKRRSRAPRGKIAAGADRGKHANSERRAVGPERTGSESRVYQAVSVCTQAGRCVSLRACDGDESKVRDLTVSPNSLDSPHSLNTAIQPSY